ncbi:hypothetical protein [Brucella tritici]|uniref:hypothetical protein n=1 Tax=Brucella tritici TaxID=94626 RepID=UPI001592434E|nr:hypothetical protein [Brucella tritici]
MTTLPEEAVTLWAVIIHGPDDLIAAPDYLSAVRMSNAFNAWWLDLKTKQPHNDAIDARMWAIPTDWPGNDAQGHAVELSKPHPEYQWLREALSALEPSAARELALEEGYRQGIEAAAQKAAEMLVFADTTSTADREIPAAIRALGTSREQLNKAVSNVPDQQKNEPGAHGERELPIDRFDSVDPSESIGCYGGSGQWIELGTVADIRALSSPDHADAVRERAWYFSAGDTVPQWLEKIEKGNCTLTFGVDVVVTSKDGGYEVRPQGIADNAGPILHVVNQGNVTPEIKGGGNGVAIIGYNRPYDETAGRRIARVKRLLEMARPYVECYDTREHNSEQDAVLTEIDKALSVVVGETRPEATHPSGGDRHGE